MDRRHYPFLQARVCRNGFAGKTDLMILAENAVQVTSGKENVADAVLSVNSRFLTAMDADG
jgi:hypothetical protein